MVFTEIFFNNLKNILPKFLFTLLEKGRFNHKIVHFLFLFDSLLKLIGVFAYVKITLQRLDFNAAW